MVEAPGFAERLSERMKARKIGVRHLARDSGLDKSTVSSWKRGGQRLVRVDKVRRVASVLETTAEDLLGLPAPAPPPDAMPSSQDELLRRLADLQPTLEALVAPTPDLLEALDRHQRRLAQLQEALAELSRLAGGTRPSSRRGGAA